MLFRFFILVLFISCSTEKYNWFSGTVDEALLLIESNPEKLILLDFYFRIPNLQIKKNLKKIYDL